MTGRAVLGLLALALVVGAIFFLVTRLEGGEPEIAAPETLLLGADGRDVELVVDDGASGLRSLRVVLAHARGEAVLLEEEYGGSAWTGALRRGPRELAIRVSPESHGVPDGDAFLRIQARDWSWRGGFDGNEAALEVPVRVDRKPPRVAVASGLTYISRGGAGAVAWRVFEKPERTGVQVGDAFFPGFPLGGRYVAVFAVPTDSPPSPRVRVVAVDAAGNRGEAGWPAVVKERVLPEADVNLPQSFLDRVVPDLAASAGIASDDPSAAFREINTRVRSANEARIREIVADSAGEPLWDGRFAQLENSKVTSRFAEQRTYVVAGERNSQATHFGYDLASTRAAPITATAAGRVLFAEELGIYGNCVILDHGLGVASLYGHLSRIDVAAGDAVERGQTLGLSGATGLAGGDHLHFAILVGGYYVDPLEWWDAKWLATHVDARVRPEPATSLSQSR